MGSFECRRIFKKCIKCFILLSYLSWVGLTEVKGQLDIPGNYNYYQENRWTRTDWKDPSTPHTSATASTPTSWNYRQSKSSNRNWDERSPDQSRPTSSWSRSKSNLSNKWQDSMASPGMTQYSTSKWLDPKPQRSTWNDARQNSYRPPHHHHDNRETETIRPLPYDPPSSYSIPYQNHNWSPTPSTRSRSITSKPKPIDSYSYPYSPTYTSKGYTTLPAHVTSEVASTRNSKSLWTSHSPKYSDVTYDRSKVDWMRSQEQEERYTEVGRNTDDPTQFQRDNKFYSRMSEEDLTWTEGSSEKNHRSQEEDQPMKDSRQEIQMELDRHAAQDAPTLTSDTRSRSRSPDHHDHDQQDGPGDPNYNYPPYESNYNQNPVYHFNYDYKTIQTTTSKPDLVYNYNYPYSSKLNSNSNSNYLSKNYDYEPQNKYNYPSYKSTTNNYNYPTSYDKGHNHNYNYPKPLYDSPDKTLTAVKNYNYDYNYDNLPAVPHTTPPVPTAPSAEPKFNYNYRNDYSTPYEINDDFNHNYKFKESSKKNFNYNPKYSEDSSYDYGSSYEPSTPVHSTSFSIPEPIYNDQVNYNYNPIGSKTKIKRNDHLPALTIEIISARPAPSTSITTNLPVTVDSSSSTSRSPLAMTTPTSDRDFNYNFDDYFEKVYSDPSPPVVDMPNFDEKWDEVQTNFIGPNEIPLRVIGKVKHGGRKSIKKLNNKKEVKGLIDKRRKIQPFEDSLMKYNLEKVVNGFHEICSYWMRKKKNGKYFCKNK